MNKAFLLGRLGKEPELRQTAGGVSVCNFPVATSERYKDKEGKIQENTDWHNIVVWGGTANACSDMLRKGSQVLVEGKIQTRSYDDRDGNKRYITEIVSQTIKFISDFGDQSQGQNQQTKGEYENPF